MDMEKRLDTTGIGNKKPQANFGLGVRLSSAWRRYL
jgi:hypothetical protein